MRVQARLLLGMFGLAFAVPMLVTAAPFDENAGAYAVPGGQPNPQPAPHHHKGLLHRRHCVECQRAYVKAHDGVDVPAPPPLEHGAMMHGQVMAAQGGSCTICQGNVVTSGPMMAANGNAPGYAVVGGPPVMASADAPGYAVVGEAGLGSDPTPIGVSRSGHAASNDPRMAAMGPRPAGGPYDPSVVPTSTPPAQVALAGPGADRPHIIGHLLGIPKLGQMRRAAEDKERQKHAAIAYDQPNAKVSELPASMVYGNGKGDH
jgi:hypothetical protein